jgi:hypothetical protein
MSAAGIRAQFERGTDYVSLFEGHLKGKISPRDGSPTGDTAKTGKNSCMFDGFLLDFVDVGEVSLRVRSGGEGPAVLLVHGHPRTHATWCGVAPRSGGSRLQRRVS